MSDHLDIPTLIAYADGELEPTERQRCDAHVAGCPQCSAAVDEQRRVRAGIGRAGSERAEARVDDRSWRAVASGIQQVSRRRRAGRVLLVAAAAALAFTITRVPERGRDETDSFTAADLELARAVEAGRPRLDSASKVAVASLFTTIDAAIRDAERALAADPHNAFLADYLGGLRRRRVDTLRDVLAMIQHRA